MSQAAPKSIPKEIDIVRIIRLPRLGECTTQEESVIL
jgi:hypothetical protein